ncbi:alpha/beta hydrolase [Acetivibrio straminisolvens]|jgi:alpha-beta hydrolase superfamily lysophospholipase|uniref:Lysophospholipase n=1 Tax=Acetivibrio straminisolvens JCM 21531 TaxID=1294263 RepID=W4V312_9FIRM|nr:alpha/beta hydrolase [Acetivibrio straminisolvens]GAE87114.1 lysophospholipase [Acetivibrio straminisolvens JCM 21531]
MIAQTFTFKARDNIDIFVYKWVPKSTIRGIVQIAHGIGEHAGRYENFAKDLLKSGYAVYANDHRGHGKTAKALNQPASFGDNCWNLMVEDSWHLTEIIRKENPHIPVFFFGHSMGSFLLRQYLYEYPNRIDGAILAGTGVYEKFLVEAGILIIKRLINKGVDRKKSYYINKMIFKGFNSRIDSPKTNFDWLCRDEKTVRNFINDPLCSIPRSNNFFYEFLCGIREVHRKENIEKIPKNTPIFIISGDKDPVGHWGSDIPALARQYEKMGIKDVTYKLYEDARHELVNELNRNEVIQDIITWMNNRNPLL